MLNYSHDYENARKAADAIRLPNLQHPRLIGLRGLSCRTPVLVAGTDPFNYALFVIPPFRVVSPSGNAVLVLPATLVQQWELHIEHHLDTQRNSVSVASPNVDWRHPRFRL